VLLGADEATSFVAALLRGSGATEISADTVARHLVESDLRGVASHGLMRVTQYLEEIASGDIDPAAVPSFERTAETRIWVEGNRCFGQLAGSFAADEAAKTAAVHGVAVVTVRHTGHAGRIGAYAERLARCGPMALACCSGPPSGHWLAPFGGVEGRLATNPIAYAFPTQGEPVVADFSTSAVPEGTVRRLRELDLPVPEGALQDAAGRTATEPGVLYANPPGTILPLGGQNFGHKGFALALLVETLATLLAGDDTADATRYGNNLALIAIATDTGFQGRAERLAEHVRSARPVDPARPVLMPGDLERGFSEVATAIRIDRSTWRALTNAARERSVGLPLTRSA
jgi:hydroxycarboxylate dehydrogenase B